MASKIQIARVCAIGICTLLLIHVGLAQDAQDEGCLKSTCRSVPQHERLAVIGSGYIRGVVGGFEQGAGIGGGVQFTSKDLIPSVTARANALVSSRFYRRGDLELFVPRLGSSKNHADAWFSYAWRNSNFFGIGPRIPRDFRTDFAVEQRSFQVSLLRDLAAHLQGGTYVAIMDAHSFKGRNKVDPIDATFFTDAADPVSLWAPGLNSNSRILSYGTYLVFDTRDYSGGLVRGMQLFGRFATFDGLKYHNAFTDYGWNEEEADLRFYIPLRHRGTTLALRSRGQLKQTKGGSQIPFYDLSWLGGREFVRGYETYRFRANNDLMFSMEIRQTVWVKSDVRGLDVFAFADSGQVWGDSRSSDDLSILNSRRFSSSNWHSGTGGGFQYRWSRKLAGRIEAGRSNEKTLLYFSMSQGF